MKNIDFWNININKNSNFYLNIFKIQNCSKFIKHFIHGNSTKSKYPINPRSKRLDQQLKHKEYQLILILKD